MDVSTSSFPNQDGHCFNPKVHKFRTNVLCRYCTFCNVWDLVIEGFELLLVQQIHKVPSSRRQTFMLEITILCTS